jgi:hypothetical protein
MDMIHAFSTNILCLTAQKTGRVGAILVVALIAARPDKGRPQGSPQAKNKNLFLFFS